MDTPVHQDRQAAVLSVVIPVLNEQETLPALYERLSAAAEAWETDYEVIVVDDGSTDLTPEILDEIHRKDHRWKRLSFSRNFGHQAAVSAGLHYTQGDAVAIIDGDLQDPPEVLHQLFEKWRRGYDVVYAVRRSRKEGILKRTAYSAFYRVLKGCASIDIPLDAGDFCVMDRRVVKVLSRLPERSRFVRGLRSWAGFRQTGVEYEREARFDGVPKYSLSKLFRLAFDGILSFSSSPLRLSSWLGFGLCGLSVLLVLMLAVWWASEVTILGMHPRQSAGWTSLVSLILFVGGLQMLMVGIMGEYVARVFDEVKARPQWLVADLNGFAVDTLPHDIGRVCPTSQRHEAEVAEIERRSSNVEETWHADVV